MVEILGQLVEFEILGYACHAPWLGYGFKGTEHQFTCVFFIVGTFIGNAQNGQLGQARNRFRHDIEMFTSMQWHVNACHAAHLMAPHTRAVYDHVTGDVPMAAILGRPINACHTATCAGNVCHLGPFCDGGTTHPRAFCQCQRDVGRVALAVFVQEHTTHNTVQIQVAVFRTHLRR